jgi:hypothetical protein
MAMSMLEMSSKQYRAHAERCRLLADDSADPVRKLLYRQMERSYLTLADSQEILELPSPSGGPP